MKKSYMTYILKLNGRMQARYKTKNSVNRWLRFALQKEVLEIYFYLNDPDLFL